MRDRIRLAKTREIPRRPRERRGIWSDKNDGSGAGERPEVQLDHPWIVDQILPGSGVRVAALIEDVTAVADLQAPPGVLLDHDDRDAGRVDLLGPEEHLVLQRRGEARGGLVEQQDRRL